jgi:hypothetical protein
MDSSRHYQTTARDAHRGLCLVGTVRSPFFPTVASTRDQAPIRDIHLFLEIMDFLIDSWGVSAGNPYSVVSWWDSSNTFQSSDIVFMTWANVKANGIAASAFTAINTYASAHSLTVNSIRGLPGTLSGAPAATIAAVVTNLATNYNLATGVLGLANALNTANGAQNDLGTKFNTLIAELNTLGILA